MTVRRALITGITGQDGSYLAEICIVGTGCVGLVAGAYLAGIGHRVVCKDVCEIGVGQVLDQKPDAHSLEGK